MMIKNRNRNIVRDTIRIIQNLMTEILVSFVLKIRIKPDLFYSNRLNLRNSTSIPEPW